MSAHSTYSGSKAPRVIRCPGSVAAGWSAEDKSSEYADEGTAAHTLSAWCLEKNQDAAEYIGEVIHVYEDDEKTVRRSFEVDDDMAEPVQTYVDQIRALPGEKLIEVRVDYSDIIGVPEQGGTSDCVVLNFEAEELGVHDLKFGRGVKVWASYIEDDVTYPNEQLAAYAMGAIKDYDLVSWARVKLAIHQPRLGHYDEYIITVDELRAFAQSYRAAVAEAESGFEERDKDTEVGQRSPLSRDELHKRGMLRPGEKQCRWCPVAEDGDGCPALTNQARSNAFEDFEKAIAKNVDELPVSKLPTPEELAVIETYVKGAYARITKEIRARKKVEGWILGRGSLGPRKWVKGKLKEIEKKLKGFRIKAADLYKKTLLTPTQAEKKLKPEQYAKLEEAGLIERKEGSEHVMPAHPNAQVIDLANVNELLCDDSDLI